MNIEELEKDVEKIQELDAACLTAPVTLLFIIITKIVKYLGDEARRAK